MSIISILFALLLSGSANFTTQTNSIIGGGPVSAAPASSPNLGGVSVDDAFGGPVS